MKILANALSVVILAGICFPQVQPYVGAGFGLPGMGFSYSYVADAGIDVNIRRLFMQAEIGADTGYKEDVHDGYTVRTHGTLMLRTTKSWSFGGGIHYSALTTSAYKKHNRWPALAAMYEHDFLRGTLNYLLPGSDDRYNLTGAIVDLRFRLKRGLYWRQRLGIFVFRNPFEANPSYHKGAELNWSLAYVFRDRKE